MPIKKMIQALLNSEPLRKDILCSRLHLASILTGLEQETGFICPGYSPLVEETITEMERQRLIEKKDGKYRIINEEPLKPKRYLRQLVWPKYFQFSDIRSPRNRKALPIFFMELSRPERMNLLRVIRDRERVYRVQRRIRKKDEMRKWS